MKFTVFLFILLWSVTSIAQKKQVPFSGELVYQSKVVHNKSDSLYGKMLIYAKDSLLKTVTFTSELGKQEFIYHLRLNKSYLLITTTKGNYAIKMPYSEMSDTTDYQFKKQCGHKMIAGKKAKKLKVKLDGIDKSFTFYYFKDIAPQYGSAYTKMPGLVAEYFIPTDRGLLKYEIISLKEEDTPLELFMIPSGYKKVTLDEFMEELSSP